MWIQTASNIFSLTFLVSKSISVENYLHLFYDYVLGPKRFPITVKLRYFFKVHLISGFRRAINLHSQFYHTHI